MAVDRIILAFFAIIVIMALWEAMGVFDALILIGGGLLFLPKLGVLEPAF